MATEVRATGRADQQIGDLTRKNTRAFNHFLDELATQGCRALAYRLTGETPLNRICVKHLRGSLRVVVAFETEVVAWVLLVGPHDEGDPVLNVYAELYRLLGIEPEPSERRSKPPCCDEEDGSPPVLPDDLQSIVDNAGKLRRTRRTAH